VWVSDFGLTQVQSDARLTMTGDGADALGKLPEGERLAWQKLWQEVEALRKSAAGSK
jgi:hypothetical protein